MEQYKVDFDSIPWDTPATGVRCKVYKQDGRQLRLVEFTNGFVESGWCEKGHIGFVLEGELEINFTGRPVVLKPGDGLFIPAGDKDKHKAKVLTDIVRLILVEDS